MINILSTNITSPLGMTTEQNYQAVKSGGSALRRYEGMWNLQEPFAASLFTEEQMADLMVDGFSRFESLILHSVREALSHTAVDVSSERVVLIVSTAKGNVDLLGSAASDDDTYPGTASRRIARELGIKTEPIVVCNACISGVASQVLAQRLLEAGLYDYAIVVGAEVQSKFIVSGFQSFKAVTDEICRPFDIERLGLNLGEGASTIVFCNGDSAEGSWHLVDGCIRNDAYHLSSPHPQGEGYRLALQSVADDQPLATLGVHGTATMYNDQMESKAIEKAGLSDVPLTSLKGYYGHTMGAAGLIETIITMRATDDGIVLGARGFEEMGVSGKINISGETRTLDGQPSDRRTFVKMLSGFGGCNGSVRWTRKPVDENSQAPLPASISTSHRVKITSDKAWVDGEELPTTTEGKALLKELYKSHVGDYPKFYKMDALTRLTFIASELLLKAEAGATVESEERAVIIFNRSSSVVADRQFYETIKDAENSFPSPAVFLYTLPNLTTGEIAIRNHYMGETSFYILPERNDVLIRDVIRVSFADKKTTSIIAGWIDCPSEDDYIAELAIYNKE